MDVVFIRWSSSAILGSPVKSLYVELQKPSFWFQQSPSESTWRHFITVIAKNGLMLCGLIPVLHYRIATLVCYSMQTACGLLVKWGNSEKNTNFYSAYCYNTGWVLIDDNDTYLDFLVLQSSITCLSTSQHILWYLTCIMLSVAASIGCHICII